MYPCWWNQNSKVQTPASEVELIDIETICVDEDGMRDVRVMNLQIFFIYMSNKIVRDSACASGASFIHHFDRAKTNAKQLLLPSRSICHFLK